MPDAAKGPWIRRVATWAYQNLLRPLIRKPIHGQRLKFATYHWWQYVGLLRLQSLSLRQRLGLIVRFLVIDWNVEHGHKPSESVAVCRAIAERPARAGEIVVEAGCWKGGSSAKFSVVCKLLGYELWIYDSFEGVEPMTVTEEEGWDFTGEYASAEDVLWDHLRRYGEPDACRSFKGWFRDTLAKAPIDRVVRVGYIDCDIVKGTGEALAGIVPQLSTDGWVFTQDYHILGIRNFLALEATWSNLNREEPVIRPIIFDLASIRFQQRDRTARNGLAP